jgi:adenylate kinase
VERAQTFTFIHGINGSGKDTQAKILSDRLANSEAISTGDVFRGAIHEDGEYAKYHKLLVPYEDGISRGELLPDDAILEVFWDLNSEQAKRGVSQFVYSGFPRTLIQLMKVDERFAWLSLQQRLFYKHVFLDLSEEEAMNRSERRREITIAKGFEPRPDDIPEVIQRRFGIFKAETMPMVESLREQGRLTVVDANATISEVRYRLLHALGLV